MRRGSTRFERRRDGAEMEVGTGSTLSFQVALRLCVNLTQHVTEFCIPELTSIAMQASTIKRWRNQCRHRAKAPHCSYTFEAHISGWRFVPVLNGRSSQTLSNDFMPTTWTAEQIIALAPD